MSEQFARTRRHAGRPGPSADQFTGRRVLDEHGLRLGSVSDVVFDPDGVRPEYLVVAPGPLRAPKYVPIDGAYSTADDRIVVTWDKQWIRHAPRVRRKHQLSSADRHLLEVHYPNR